MVRWVLLLLTALALVGCGKGTPKSMPLACNGHPELCTRSYSAVAYPGTHGSYSDTEEQFDAPDQTYPIAQQLTDGIRVLHFEVHDVGGDAFVCHGFCEFGEKPLVDDLAAVEQFLSANPSEVVTLLLEQSDAQITADQIGGAMISAGLDARASTQVRGAPWPTLGEMIDGGQRLVAFLDDPDGGSNPWLLPRWDFTWETP